MAKHEHTRQILKAVEDIIDDSQLPKHKKPPSGMAVWI